jgi:hypothetical protein
MEAAMVELVGKKFGKWTVVGEVARGYADVLCECGQRKRVQTYTLLNGRSKSCGCLRREGWAPQTQVGDRYTKLVVEKKLGTNDNGHREVIVLCDCGTRKVVPEVALRAGATKSCGCLRSARIAKQNRKQGQARAPFYRLWCAMLERTRNGDRYPSYGPRGIRVLPEWEKDFFAFSEYIAQSLGPRPRGTSLDRIENDKGYEPGNLRWATNATQMRNKSNNRYLTIRGEKRCLAEWSEIGGVSVQTIRARLKAGRSEEDAVFSPALPRNREAPLGPDNDLEEHF